MKRIVEIIGVICLLAGCTKGAYWGPGEAAADAEDAPRWLEYNAIVTVKQDAAGTVFFQLDDDTRLYPQNYTQPFTRQCRIICSLAWWSGSSQCTLQWMDYLEEGEVISSADEGDGIDVLDDWMTSVEDGYLTLHYSTFWGEGTVPHTLQLVTGENPQDPYEVRLVHLRNGDSALEQADALVYFDLAGLPPTGSGMPLTLKWKNESGETTQRTFLYKTRQ